MEPVIRSALVVLLAFVLLLLQGALAMMVSIHPFEPNLLLPIAIYLGVSQDVYIVRGVIVSFLTGYLLDLFAGSPMSHHTFLLVATFLVARLAGLRLFLRNFAFQALLTFVASVMTGAMMLALRLFEPQVTFSDEHVRYTLLSLFGPAATTAVLAPMIFGVVARAEAVASTRREEGGATP